VKKIRNLFLLLTLILNSFYTTAAQPKKISILVLTERGGQHESFTTAALQWLGEEKEKLNIEWTEINNTKPISEEYLNQFELIIQLDYPPYSWTKDFIMQRCWANLMATRCGTGFLISWEASVFRTTLRNWQMVQCM
jgi:hypothetical protein